MSRLAHTSHNSWVANYTLEGTLDYQFPVDKNTVQFIPSPDNEWGVLETGVPAVTDVGTSRLDLVSHRTLQYIPLLVDRINGTAIVQWSPDNGKVAILSKNLICDSALDIFDRQGNLLQHFENVAYDDSGIAWMPCDTVTDPGPSVLAQLPAKSHN